jgi:mxaJ protein
VSHTKSILAAAAVAYVASLGAAITAASDVVPGFSRAKGSRDAGSGLSPAPQAVPAAATLRVCGDPDNLPFSNEKLEGFENRIAAVVAGALGATPEYAWWPHQHGLVRNTINADACDVIFGVPEGLDTVLWTKPYYRTSYVIAFRSDRPYRIASLDAPELKDLRIGAYENTPPEESLARRGLIEKVRTYSLFFDPRGDRDRPLKLLADLVAGTIDVGVPWGPLAGYYKAKLDAPLTLVPLDNETGVPLAFDISLGVKKGNTDLKRRLEGALDRRQAEIRSILEDFGVPLLPLGVAARAQGQEPAPSPATAESPAPDAAATVKRLNPFLGDGEMIGEGKKLYFELGCQGCHGGGGGGGMAASLIDDVWKFGSDDDTLYKLIKGRIPRQTMPAVYADLPDDQVWKMLAFIRSVYTGDPAKINWQ